MVNRELCFVENLEIGISLAAAQLWQSGERSPTYCSPLPRGQAYPCEGGGKKARGKSRENYKNRFLRFVRPDLSGLTTVEMTSFQQSNRTPEKHGNMAYLQNRNATFKKQKKQLSKTRKSFQKEQMYFYITASSSAAGSLSILLKESRCMR